MYRLIAHYGVIKSYAVMSNARLKISLYWLHSKRRVLKLKDNARSPSFIRLLGTMYIGDVED